jgi:hypothetical protein
MPFAVLSPTPGRLPSASRIRVDSLLKLSLIGMFSAQPRPDPVLPVGAKDAPILVSYLFSHSGSPARPNLGMAFGR